MIHTSTTLRTIALTAALASLCSLTAAAQSAKDLFDKAQAPGLDQCTAMQYACKAAELDPKKKDYRAACDGARASLVGSDRDNLKRAHDALDAGKYPQATRYANYVCKYNADQEAEAKSILADVQKAQAPAVAAAAPAAPTPAAPTPAAPTKSDPSAALLAQAKASYESGNLGDAQAKASQVTDPALKQQANDITGNIARYQGAINSAKQKEGSGDLDGAIREYQAALQINARVSDGAASHMQELQAKAHAAPPPSNVAKNNPPPQPANQPKPGQPAKPAPEDPAVTAARLMDDANKAKAAGKLQDALKAYEAVLRIQPANGEAVAGRSAVQIAINSDPLEQAKTLAQAIRDFYASKYSDAEDELSSYLSSNKATSRGAAHFYLAATRLSKVVFDKQSTPQNLQAAVHSSEVQRLFKESRSEQYKPVERYVSPLVMEAWRSAN